MGYLLGLFLLFVVINSIQPEYYLRIPLATVPFSTAFYMIQIGILVCTVLLSGFISYNRLKKQIPTIEKLPVSVLSDVGENL